MYKAQFIKEMFIKMRGTLPARVFLWYVICMVVSIAVFVITAYWYSVFYTVVYTDATIQTMIVHHKRIIDTNMLTDVLERYEVKQ